MLMNSHVKQILYDSLKQNSIVTRLTIIHTKYKLTKKLSVSDAIRKVCNIDLIKLKDRSLICEKK